MPPKMKHLLCHAEDATRPAAKYASPCRRVSDDKALDLAMPDIASLRTMFKYGDWANSQLLRASSRLSDEQLDRPFDMGRGSLRLVLTHIWAGEHVWLRRWQGQSETPWPDETEPFGIVAFAERFGQLTAQRDAFINGCTVDDLSRHITYRDSKGSLFVATLGDMMLQMFVHSTHHRAQAVNLIRRVGGSPPELDYMMTVRQPT